jgi:hypothetical protein
MHGPDLGLRLNLTLGSELIILFINSCESIPSIGYFFKNKINWEMWWNGIITALGAVGEGSIPSISNV